MNFGRHSLHLGFTCSFSRARRPIIWRSREHGFFIFDVILKGFNLRGIVYKVQFSVSCTAGNTLFHTKTTSIKIDKFDKRTNRTKGYFLLPFLVYCFFIIVVL